MPHAGYSNLTVYTKGIDKLEELRALTGYKSISQMLAASAVDGNKLVVPTFKAAKAGRKAHTVHSGAHPVKGCKDCALAASFLGAANSI